MDEERARKETQAQKKASERKAEEEQRQKAADDEEHRNLSKLVEREQARLSRLQMNYNGDVESVEPEHDGVGIVTFDQEIRAKSQEGNVFAFRSIVRKGLFRKGPMTNVFTACSVDAPEYCTPCLALKECLLSTNASGDAMKKRIQALEMSLESLIHLPTHPHILKPLGFRIEKAPSADGRVHPAWKVHTLTNFMPRGSLNDLLESVGTLNVATARTWIVQILEGLDFLHRQNIAHGRLSASNILLERSKDGETTARLVDFSSQQEFYAIQEASTKFSSAASAYWLAPESANNENARPSSPRDMWDLGIVLLQMFFGLEVQRQYNAPASLVDENALSESLEKFINKVFRADPKKRPTAFELLPDAFLRNDDPILDETSSSAVSRITSLQSPAKPTRMRRGSVDVKMAASRYASDFVEMGRLGKGGYGEVVKARNKLDGSIYAIKKIAQTSAAALSGVLSEIMLLSRLNNPFIVRYYTAWIEEEEGDSRSSMAEEAMESDAEDASEDVSDEKISYLPDSNTRGLDFLSSGGYAGFEFGYDSDDDDAPSLAVETEDEQDASKSSEDDKAMLAKKARRRRSSAAHASQVTLYIQMEYCEKQTLRDLIRGDMYKNVDQVWHLFHQVLQGLAHLHQNGVIHRDIKPENIFIDQAGTARIGDFGLARPGQSSSKQSSSKGYVAPELTASIGTSVYVAPEVKSSGGGNYNEKADMYSLGVCLFEMSHPLPTAMERARTLDALRKEPCEFPTAFDEPEKALQKEITRSLLRHKVCQRPSSQELLRGGKIPSQADDQAVRAAMRLSEDKSSPFFAKLVSNLFDPTKSDAHAAKDFTYDLQVSLKTNVADLLVQSFIKDRLIEVFRRHGAVESDRPLLVPSTSLYGDEAVRLLDPSGAQVQLPYDLTLPFARMLAKQPDLAACRKTFSFGHVFRKAPAGVHPLMHGAVDFDIISNDSLDMALRESETIKVVDEVLDSVPSMQSTPVYYQISHSRLLEKILEPAPAEQRQPIKQALSRLYTGQWTWPKIRNELRSAPYSVSSTVIDDLMQLDFREPCSQAVAKLRDLLHDTEELESVFRHLDAVVTYLERFKIKRKVYLYPLASLNEQFYNGSMLFQALLDGKRKSVLCAGGRFDRLILQQRASSKGPAPHAVGFSLAWEALIGSMKTTGKRFLKKGDISNDEPAKMRRCDVLIDSSDPAILRSSGIQLAQDLWEHDFSAELVIDSGIREATSHHHQAMRDESVPHDWLVLIKPDGSVKVRSLVGKEDTEMRRAELLGWLRGEMRERDRLEGKSAKTRAAHGLHQQDSSSGHDPDVRVLSAQTRGKKTNRRNIVDEGKPRDPKSSMRPSHTDIFAQPKPARKRSRRASSTALSRRWR